MILRTRNSAEYVPFVASVATEVASSFTDGSTVSGVYTDYFLRDAFEAYLNHYVVTDGEVTNLDPGILDISGFPDVVRASVFGTPQTGRLRFTKNGISIIRSYSVGAQGSITDLFITEAVKTGTLLSHATDLILVKAAAGSKNNEAFRTISGAVPIAVFQGTTHFTVQPNPNCWASSWDFTGVPIWCSAGGAGGGSQHGGCILDTGTNRYLIEAEHFASPVGTVWKFMLSDGSIISRTSIGMNRRPAGANNAETLHLNEIPGDIRIHLLDSALPVGVKAYPVVGTWAHPTKSTGSASLSSPWQTSKVVYNPIAGVYLDQNRRAWFMGSYMNDCENTTTYAVSGIVFDGVLTSISNSTIGFLGPFFTDALAVTLNPNSRQRYGVSGDSGSACFYPLSASSLALVTCLTYPGGGPCYEAARINTLLQSADKDAIARGNLVSVTGLTVTVAASPI